MNANRRFKVFVSVQALWLISISCLVFWWGTLILKQSDRIQELERQTGLTQGSAHWERTLKMIFWESSTLYLLLFVITALSIWFFWRDQRRAKSLEAFFASFSHELRTPLTSIRLQAESLAENFPANSKEKSFILKLLEDSSRLETQVDRTLELARLEGGGPLFLESLPLKSQVESVISYWKETQPQSLNIETSLEGAWIAADRSALRMIFRNLLENAVRHSKREDLKIQIHSHQLQNSLVEVDFQDNGKGFDGDPKKLGSLFYKGPSSTGTGVGLYLIRTLIERMGGTLELQDSKGFHLKMKFKEGSTHV